MTVQRIHMAMPSTLGGGFLSGNSIEEAVGGFLNQFHPDDVKAFMSGYMDYAKRKHGVSLSQPQGTQRVALVRPQTVQASVAAPKPPQKPTAQAKATATPQRTVSVPVEAPKPLNRDEVWAKIVRLAGSDVPAKIDAFMRTPEGSALYGEYLDAAPAPVVAIAKPEPEKGGIEMAIEKRARDERLPGETIEAATVRMLTKYPNLYRAHVAEMEKKRR